LPGAYCSAGRTDTTRRAVATQSPGHQAFQQIPAQRDQLRQRVAQLDGAAAIGGAEVIDDEMPRDAAQPCIHVSDPA